MFDNLAYFYDTGPFGLATLCALGATTFAGHLDTVGVNAFDAAASTTHTLRYQDSMLLSAGDIATIGCSTAKPWPPTARCTPLICPATANPPRMSAKARWTPWPTVAAFMDAVGVDAAHLVGHSMGGAVSLTVAARHPAKVRSLSLIGSAGLGEEINTGYIDGFVSSASRNALKPFLADLFADSSLVTRQLVDDLLKYKRLEGVGAALGTLSSKLFANGRQNSVMAESLNKLGKPVLVIWGEEDRIIPVAHAHAVSGKVQVEVFGNRGHI